MKVEQEEFKTAFLIDREHNKFTQQDIANKLGVSQQMVDKWESGSIPRPKRLKKLAELFGEYSETYKLRNITKILSPAKLRKLRYEDEIDNLKFQLRNYMELTRLLKKENEALKGKLNDL